jgi:N-acetyl-anhydromuramyl-L-alanine amidase AmpD
MKIKRVLTLKMSGDDIKFMQTKLKEFGFLKEKVDGYFGQNTLIAVTNFQRKIGIKPDGIIGSQTWYQLLSYSVDIKPEKVYNDIVLEIPNKISFIGEDGLKIYDNLLEDDEYIKEKTLKDTIWLHHTAGSSRPDWTIGGWEKDELKKVATHFVIGRKSSSENHSIWDGKILKAFDDKYWAYHLGVNENNLELNSKSISIEVCNYGQLNLGKDGRFYNYINKPINNEDVVELSTPFRGYKYYEKYTDCQLDSLRKLIIYLKKRWNIEIESGIYTEEWFDYNDKWFTTGGLRTHTQVRKDKFDMFPQPELIQMLNSI